jgi:hypothetical protein
MTCTEALLAQLAERSLSKRKVGGSIPPVGSLFIHQILLLNAILFLSKHYNQSVLLYFESFYLEKSLSKYILFIAVFY